MKRRTTALAFFALLAPVVAWPAEGVDVYLTLEEAPKVVFPEADSFERKDIPADDGFRQRMKELIGRAKPTIWEPFYISFIAKKQGKVAGYAVVCEEIGKHRPITFIVAVSPDGRVKDVALMMYREPVGAEVRYESFLRQFSGKNLDDPIMQHRDIRNISGATLSVLTMSRGVRKALAVIQLAYLEKGSSSTQTMHRTWGQRFSTAAPGAFALPVPAGLLRSAPPLSRGALRRVRRARYVMGTIFEITAWGRDRAETAAAVEEAFAAIRHADEVMSDYRPESDLSRLNRLGGREAVPVPAELHRILGEAARFSGLSAGAFDITVGSFLRLWERAEERDFPPDAKELAKVRTRVGWRKVRLLPVSRAWFSQPDLQVGLGAIGKGWAIDQALAVLRSRGIQNAFLSAGTSTVYALGDDGLERGWLVGIRDPSGSDEDLFTTLRLRDASLSTSGGYERYWEIAGRRYPHIVDPRTGRPVEGMLNSSVIAPSATEADALSTAVFVLGLDDGSALLERLKLAGCLVGGAGPRGTLSVRLVRGPADASWSIFDGSERVATNGNER